MPATKADYMKLVPAPGRESINKGLSPAKHATMLRLFGRPGAMTRDCTEPTGRIAARLVTKRISPVLKVRGFGPSVTAFEKAMAEIKVHHPILHSIMGTAGMTCCRAVRGSTQYYSNHSWGTGIDLTVGGILAPLNATKIPYGLVVAYFYFHKYGFFWAQGYRGRTDPMHIETAQETLLRWKRQGII